MIRSIRCFYNGTPTRWRFDTMRDRGRTIHCAWIGPVFMMVVTR